MSAHYLSKIHERIVPTDAELVAVQAAVDAVTASTRELMPLAEVRPAGSWAKKTMLRGRKEADIVAILAEAPTDFTLEEMRRHLAGLDGLRGEPTVSYKAVNLEFQNGVSIDLLPIAKAGRTPSGPSVPRKLRHAWSGVEHVQWLRANAHGTVTHQVIRLAKHLRDAHSASMGALTSFAIEAMCVEMKLTGDLYSAFEGFLAQLAGGWVEGRRLTDPANPNNDLLEELRPSDRTAITRAASLALSGARASTWSAVFPSGDSGTLPPPASNLGGRTLG
jgi:hypothetical protein